MSTGEHGPNSLRCRAAADLVVTALRRLVILCTLEFHMVCILHYVCIFFFFATFFCRGAICLNLVLQILWKTDAIRLHVVRNVLVSVFVLVSVQELNDTMFFFAGFVGLTYNVFLCR